MADRLLHKEKQGGWQWWVLAGIVAVVAVLSIVTVFVKQHRHHDGGSPAPPLGGSSSAPPPSASVFYPPPQSTGGSVVAKYAEPLKLSLQFFEIQKSGKLPSDNPITWRGDSALSDGKDVGLDLVGGMYDAGDHIKFGLPMAFTATILSWSILEYRAQYNATQQLDSAKSSVRWITDYLIKAHPSDNVLYFQVGDPSLDHACWERAEKIDTARPSYKVDTRHPGTEVAAETAASMAAASLVFRDEDPSYSDTLLTHARQLFTFADKYRGSYTASFSANQKYYNSTGYLDELLWAASWMYYATKEQDYLDYATGKIAETNAGWGKAPAWFSWDDKLAGVQVLLARHHLFQPEQDNPTHRTGLEQYKATAEQLVCAFLPESPTATTNRTKDGMLWVSQWNSVQHAVNSAFLATVYADYLSSTGFKGVSCSGRSFTARDLRAFAASQADYILGKNSMSKSYLVGYGTQFPQQLHHRGSSIPLNSATGCKDGFQWFHAASPNPNLAAGALVGGPFQNDSYVDTRENSMQNEATTYNSAALAALLVALYANGPALPNLY